MICQFCTFRLGDYLFGIPVADVQEVLRAQQITPVPLSGEHIGGLINLRGQIVTAIELRHLLALPTRPDGIEPIHVVVKGADSSRFSLVVDEIGDVLEPSLDDFETAPETMPEAVRHLVDSVCKLDGQLLLVLDTQRATALEGSR